MKIGISCYPTFGGSGAVATELGLQLARRGHEVHFISYAQPFRLSHFQEGIYFHEVEMEQYPLFEHPPYTLALAVALHDAAEKHALDLVHVHYAIPHAASAWLAGQMLQHNGGLKVVTTLHGTDITLVGQHPSFHSITRFSILQSDAITAVSEFLRRRTVRNFAVPVDRIEVIPNFIDPEVYTRDKEPCHRPVLAPHGEKVVMHVSNFRSVKRVEHVVEIFARIHRAVPSRLVMVGDGPDRPRARERAEDLGVSDSVLFLGKHAAVDELLACADLFLLPSRNESFGLAALEAMACGTPVIATNTGGLPEVVADGETGYLLPFGAVDEMAEAALGLLRDEDRWRQFSAAAREVAVHRFAHQVIVPRYEDLYRRLVAGEVGVATARPDRSAGSERS